MLGKAQELNLPTSLVDRFLGDSDEDTEQNLKALKETFDKYVQKVLSLNLNRVEEMLENHEIKI